MGPVCCGLIPHLELAHRHDLIGQPAAVDRGDGYVLAATDEANAAGVQAGCTLRQAEALCPTVVIVAPDPMATSRLAERLAAELYELTPTVEVRNDGRAWLDLEGVPRVASAIAETRRRLRAAVGVEPRLGLAPGPFAAMLAAARARRGRLVRVEDAAVFLSPLPVYELGLDAEQMDRLDLLGLRTLGAVAALGPRQLQSQLGKIGWLAALLARGSEPIPLRPWRPLMVTGARCQLEPPVDDRQALLFVARGLCADLAGELSKRGAGARKVRVLLGVEESSIGRGRPSVGRGTPRPYGPEKRESTVRHPLSSTAELFGLVSSWLSEWQPAAPVNELIVEIPELDAVGQRQLGLWMGGDGSADEVDAAVERLQARYGDSVALRARLALPSSPLPDQRYALTPA